MLGIEMWFFLVLSKQPLYPYAETAPMLANDVVNAAVRGPRTATGVGPFPNQASCDGAEERIRKEQSVALEVILPCWRAQ
jgi:hypothetical protein